MRRRPWMLALLIVTTVVACGDDGGLSEADYVEAIEPACSTRNAEMNALHQPIPAAPDQAYIDRVVAGSVPIIEAYLDAVVDTGPPDGLEDEHAKYVAALRTILVDYEEGATDPEKARALYDRPVEDLPELERELGLVRCTGAVTEL